MIIRLFQIITVNSSPESFGKRKGKEYDMRADGYSLDDKRTPLASGKHDNDNLPDILARWRNRTGEEGRMRTDQSFFVPKAELMAKGYDLSLNRYRELTQETVAYASPDSILDELAVLEDDIQSGLTRLRVLLRGELVNP